MQLLQELRSLTVKHTTSLRAEISSRMKEVCSQSATISPMLAWKSF